MKRMLLVIDGQNDFCPGGRLPVPNGSAIVPRINLLMERGGFDATVATQDWHPAGHVSFAETHGKRPFETVRLPCGEQTLWPEHCVQGTSGAEFVPGLEAGFFRCVVRKGFRPDMDGYSGFFENDKATPTGLNGLLRELAGGEEPALFLCGIATDVCVLQTALDARVILGYESVAVVEDACAGVTPEGEADALLRMKRAGIALVRAADVMEKGGKR